MDSFKELAKLCVVVFLISFAFVSAVGMSALMVTFIQKLINL